MERIQTDAGTEFTLKEFQEGLYVHGVPITLAETELQEMNGQVGVTWQTLQNISHLIMVHTLVLDKYIHFALMCTAHHTFWFHQPNIW